MATAMLRRMQVYGWPFGLTRKWQRFLKPYRNAWNGFWGGLRAKCTCNHRRQDTANAHV